MITISYADLSSTMSNEDKEALSLSPERWARKPRLTQDEVIALAQAKDAGNIDARNKLVEHNMQLVIRIAQSWTGRGVPLEDLIQEGAIGLMRAADLYDYRRGTTFSTFAGLRIVSACQRAVENQAELIRIPVHTRSSGRCAPEVARAKRVVSGDKVRDIFAGHGHNYKGMEASLFARIADDSNDTADEAIAAVSANETAAAIAAALLCLNPQERAVIEARYLSGSPDPVTQGAVGKQLGISKQRVEQVQKTAFEKLRATLEGAADAN